MSPRGGLLPANIRRGRLFLEAICQRDTGTDKDVLEVCFTDGTLDVRYVVAFGTGRASLNEHWPHLSATKMWPMNCDFEAYEVVRIFAGVYCRRGDEPEFSR